jgi:CubicO group peptidase (beta-lactamase class C family)
VPFEGGGGGLVSTVSDMLAFGRMMMNEGRHGAARLLSRAAVEVMTTDQITPEQKVGSPFFPEFWDACGWGLGLGLITRRNAVGRSVGSFGWDGAFGTSFWVDPREELVGVLMTQRTPAVLATPSFVTDFWTSAYQALDH